MELNDAVRRIIGQHWRLIIACMVLSVGVTAGLRLGHERTYTASTRFVLDTLDPKSQPESAAIADTARAIATSPTQVRHALADARVSSRDPGDVAKHHVAIQALGTSAVLQLSVTDPDPRAASAMSVALATRVIQTRLQVTRGQVDQVIGDLDRRIDDFSRQISSTDEQIATLTVRSATAPSAAASNRFRSRRDELARERDFLAQRRSVLESQRVAVLSSGALKPKPEIISAAQPPAHPDPSGSVPNLILGLLFGFILGVGAAGLRETLRPSVVGGDAVAAELGAPLLGRLPARPGAGLPGPHLTPIAMRLRLAAKTAGLRNIRLLSGRTGVDVSELADWLETAGDGTGANGATGARAKAVGAGSGALPEHAAASRAPEQDHLPPQIRTFEYESALRNGVATGLALVVPDTVKRAELEETSHLLRVSSSPLLGVITYPPRKRRHARRASRD
jgi:hypothetical protein